MYQKKEDAVSPVIGVILMVAITVILAAVIAAFVFGMAGNVSSTKNVAITAQETANDRVTLTNNGGSDVDKVSVITIQTSGSTVGSSVLTEVGSYVTVDLLPTGRKDDSKRVIVTGKFTDGSTSILLDKDF